MCLCGKEKDVPTNVYDAIHWSKHVNEIGKERWKRRGLISVGFVAIAAWAGLWAVGFVAQDRPERIDAEVKALTAAVSKAATPAENEPHGWLVDKETRTQARIAALAAFTAVLGFVLGRTVKNEGG